MSSDAKTAKEPVQATITGKISRSIGGPLGGAVIKSGTSECSSNAKGEYNLKVMLTNKEKIVVSASCPGFLTETNETELSPAGTLNLNFTLGKGRTEIVGHVYDKESGESLSEAYVTIETARTYTDESGCFAFKELEALRKYPITVIKDGYETSFSLSELTENGKPLKCDVKLEKKKVVVEETPSDTKA